MTIAAFNEPTPGQNSGPPPQVFHHKGRLPYPAPRMNVATFTLHSRPSGGYDANVRCLPSCPNKRPGDAKHIIDRHGPQMCQHVYDELTYSLGAEPGNHASDENSAARLLLWAAWLYKDNVDALVRLQIVRRMMATAGTSRNFAMTYSRCKTTFGSGGIPREFIERALAFAATMDDRTLVSELRDFHPADHDDQYLAFMRVLIGITT